MKHPIELKINGDTYSLAVDPWRTLNEVLREDLNLTGTKLGCGSGVQTKFVEARPVSLLESRKIEERKPYGTFELVGKITCKKHERRMGLDAIDDRRSRIVSPDLGHEFDDLGLFQKTAVREFAYPVFS